MNTIPQSPLRYKQCGPGIDSVCNHPAHPELYGTDQILPLSECPFPLETPAFAVLAYGRETGSKAGRLGTWALVCHTKGCGHTCHERIRFEEGVQDFEHYGTKFTGASYSVNDWQNRIEFFRQSPCPVCSLVNHGVWIYNTGEGPCSRAKAEQHTLMLLNYNFENWQDFTTPEAIHTLFINAKYGSI